MTGAHHEGADRQKTTENLAHGTPSAKFFDFRAESPDFRWPVTPEGHSTLTVNDDLGA
jgi:hypothetical protein